MWDLALSGSLICRPMSYSHHQLDLMTNTPTGWYQLTGIKSEDMTGMCLASRVRHNKTKQIPSTFSFYCYKKIYIYILSFHCVLNWNDLQQYPCVIALHTAWRACVVQQECWRKNRTWIYGFVKLHNLEGLLTPPGKDNRVIMGQMKGHHRANSPSLALSTQQYTVF